MKNLLPKTKYSPQGFTLIELMVVISIIAILSVIGLTIFSGAQKGARNATRRADIDAIANALEVNRNPVTGAYVALAGAQFASGIIPQTDPQKFVYCGNTTLNAQPGDLTAASTTLACTPAPGAAGYSPISATIPLPGTAWKICTWLELANGSVAGPYCKASSQ